MKSPPLFKVIAVVALVLGAWSAAGAQQPAATQPSPVSPPPASTAAPSGSAGLRLMPPGGAGSSAPGSVPATSGAPLDASVTESLFPRESRAPTTNNRPPADPTMPSPAIRDLIEQGTTRPGPAAPTQTPGIPEVRIRARVFAKGKPPVAVLEIAGKQLTVRLNSEIHIPGTSDAPTGVQLKVVELSPTELRLEVLKRNQSISLN